ncbi:MAG: protein kinase [Kofleriaceae bacterium]
MTRSSASMEGTTGDVGCLVYSSSAEVREELAKAAATAGQPCELVTTADALIAAAGAAPGAIVVVDRREDAADAAIRRVATLPGRDRTVVMIVREPGGAAPRGVAAVILDSELRHALLALFMTTPPRRGTALELMNLSVLAGHLDGAIDRAASQIASTFGVARCVISIRGEITCAPIGENTLDATDWQSSSHWSRAAATIGTTLVVPSATGTTCESYLAVAIENADGPGGFVSVISASPRIFTRDDRLTLHAIAARLEAELSWRGVHERTLEELDVLLNAPGLDRLLSTWNRVATLQLATMYAALARRSMSVTVIALDIVDLQAINTRHGMAIGDRLLRRVADALRPMTRVEDVIGRWSGSKLVMLLLRTAIDDARRVVERMQQALASRPLELPGGDTLAIPAAFGVASLLQDDEDAHQLIERAVAATRMARRGSVTEAAPATASRRNPQPFDVVGLEHPTTLGGTFRLLHEISRGGMGVVYRAQDLALERPVAIKMLRPELAEASGFVEQLRVEAAILARLQHPNLVQIYNFGQTGGDCYFVMELVEGEVLEQAVARHRAENATMGLAEVVGIVDQIASALDALHDRGIVHRDVKPANIIRDPFNGRSVLVDVGIARRFGTMARLAGTPGYISPEVFNGCEATARSDVYGLAATAYLLLTMQPAWGTGDPSEVVARQFSAPMPLPSSLRAELRPADALFESALSADPEQRPASAGAFARRLSLALDVLPKATKSDAGRPYDSSPARALTVPKTRGVVFRSVARALGTRDTERLRDAIGSEHAELARAVSDAAPLAWMPTELFLGLLTIAPPHIGRDATKLARDVARATVRASFRRFFPASAATLVPDRTLSAIRNVWGRYQSWGTATSMPVDATEMVVRLADTIREPVLCEWTSGMLEQLVVLSGGREVSIIHDACEAHGEAACLFRVTWATCGVGAP